MSPSKKKFFQKNIKYILSKYPDAETCWIAYSGGLDSHVLLHALTSIHDEIKPKLVAVHINHGISENSESWVKHCQNVCKNYEIKFLTFTINLSCQNGQGIEALAREKRYKIFSGLMKCHDVLLTAHHADDQAETILLQLMRGSGADGLVGMPQSRKFSEGLLVRPLLDISRKEVHSYAQNESLSWIEDESNKLNKYDRNYLRNEVIPALRIRWPGLLKTVSRAITHQVDAKNLIDEVSENDLELIRENRYSKINLDKFSKLSLIRKKNVLRAWVKKNYLEIPSSQIIRGILTEVIAANTDNNPCLNWKGIEVRRYRGYLYVMKALPTHEVKISKSWDLKKSLELVSGRLKSHQCKGNGIKKEMISNDIVEIRYRQGGESIRLLGRTYRHKLKKLYQSKGILPWLRNRIPLIYYNNELIAVGDLWIEHKYAASPSEDAWKIRWDWYFK